MGAYSLYHGFARARGLVILDQRDHNTGIVTLRSETWPARSVKADSTPKTSEHFPYNLLRL